MERTIPVNPPKVNRKIKPKAQCKDGVFSEFIPWNVLSHLKTLIPVGMAIIIVAEVK